MTAQQKREKPEIAGKAKPEPEMSGRTQPRPEMTGKNKPGTMPENPANVDREHEPAGIDPGTDRTKER
ncbi:hypothetical protein [Dongia sedimenti]|uniref:Uncharacterized protein n=1 Tax=Dongia sedimenti TaxID=3064282 RepID=A0ABU0YNX4_9PROT|nr:hypothetical protein [Rhodospirillaceae bacterium R-7]